MVVPFVLVIGPRLGAAFPRRAGLFLIFRAKTLADYLTARKRPTCLAVMLPRLGATGQR